MWGQPLHTRDTLAWRDLCGLGCWIPARAALCLMSARNRDASANMAGSRAGGSAADTIDAALLGRLDGATASDPCSFWVLETHRRAF